MIIETCLKDFTRLSLRISYNIVLSIFVVLSYDWSRANIMTKIVCAVHFYLFDDFVSP